MTNNNKSDEGNINPEEKPVKSKEQKKKERKRIGLVVGIAAGAAIVVIILILLLCTYCIKNEDKDALSKSDEVSEVEQDSASGDDGTDSDSDGDNGDTGIDGDSDTDEPDDEDIPADEDGEDPIDDNDDPIDGDDPDPEDTPPPDDDEDIEETVAPTISLSILEGPVYSPADGVCYYRVEAAVTGDPDPAVSWNRDDSFHAFGEKVAQVNLSSSSDSFTLTGTATNTAGDETASILLTWGCNAPPVIDDITPSSGFYIGGSYSISAIVSDPDGDPLTYSWSVSGGSISDPAANPITWAAPGSPGSYTMTITVSDGNGGSDTLSKTIEVAGNSTPILGDISIFVDGTTSEPADIYTGHYYDLFIDASDPDGDPLSYSWEVTDGNLYNAFSNPSDWTTPTSAAFCSIYVTVDDGNGGVVTKHRTVPVKYYVY